MDTAELRQIERTSDEIDEFIERRHAQREKANAEAAAERLREPSYLRYRNGDHTQEWVEFYRMQIRAAESARARAVERLGQLIGGAARGR